MDGFCAAYIARLALPNAQFFPTNYGQPLPDVTGKDVLIADFSYPRETLLELKEKANSLIVLDHHKTAEKDLQGLEFCMFDLARSGASLVRDFFFPESETTDPIKRHWLIDYIEDRDLWNNRLPNTKEVSAALLSYPLNFETWDELWTSKRLAELITEGRSILRYQFKIAQEAINNAQEIKMGGHSVLITNSNVMQSEIASALAVDRPFGVVWSQLKNGKFRYSLRSIKEADYAIDVAEFAKLYGGGGHKTAAGFLANSIIHFGSLPNVSSL